MFEQTFVDHIGVERKRWPVAVSLAFQSVFAAVLVGIPLMSTAKLTWLPPVAIYTPPKPVQHVKQVLTEQRAIQASVPHAVFSERFAAPRRVPEKIATIIDGPASPVPASSQIENGLGGILGIDSFHLAKATPPTAPAIQAAKPKQSSIRVGTGVQAAKLLRQVKPAYPPLARAARVAGTVRLTAIIDREGGIRNLQLIEGPPLLVEAALSAVRQWLYQPTLLNGEPVEVITEIDVNFTLAN